MDVEAMDVEHLLRENLAHRADEVAPPPRDLHDRTLAGFRRQRHHRIGLAAAGLAAAVLVGWIGWLGPAVTTPTAQPATGEAATGDLSAPPEGPAAASGDDVGGPSLFDLPVRGSLAHDVVFLAGVAGLDWPGGPSARPAGATRVLFAGEVPGGQRWALIAADVQGQPMAAWFTGPAGATGDELDPIGDLVSIFPGEPIALLDATEESGPLVVIGWPDDVVQYRPSPAQGELWSGATAVTLPGEDGVAMGLVPRPGTAGDATVSVIRNGETTLWFTPPILK